MGIEEGVRLYKRDAVRKVGEKFNKVKLGAPTESVVVLESSLRGRLHVEIFLLFIFGGENIYTFDQGCVIRRFRIIRHIVMNAYFTVLNKLGRIIR